MKSNESRIALIIGIILLMFGAFFFVTNGNAQTPSGHGTSSTNTHQGKLPASMNNACKNEDSVNCYWNAKERGNGKGLSYVVRLFPGKNHLLCVMYLGKTNQKNDYCTKA